MRMNKSKENTNIYSYVYTHPTDTQTYIRITDICEDTHYLNYLRF